MEEQKKKEMSQKTYMTKMDNPKAISKVKTGNMITGRKSRTKNMRTDKVGTNKGIADKAPSEISNIRKYSTNQQTGITLIALVISIIVMLILAGISLSMTVGENGIVTKAQRANITSELVNYQEQFETYKASKVMENGEFLEESLTAGKSNLYYNTQNAGETGNIKTIIPDISDVYLEQLEVIKGQLLLNTQDENLVKIAKALGIEVNPYDIVEGELLSSTGNLLLVDETGTLTLPNSITSIGNGAFANVEGLKTIIIPGTCKVIGTNAFYGNTTLEKVVIQEGVEVIGVRAFQGCTNLKLINLPESLTTISVHAFHGCSSIEEISIPSKIEVISKNVFCNCSKLSEVTLKGDGVTTIDNEAFYGCAITDFTITENVESISSSSFGNCKNLENITVETDKFIYESGMLFNKSKDTLLFLSTKYYENNTTLSIPEGVTDFSVNISALKITTLEISSTVNTLGSAIRYLPSTITTVNIDEDNTTFKVLEDCIYTKDNKKLIWCFSKAKEITLTNQVTTVSGHAFGGATNATKVTLADSTTSIGEQAFKGKINEIVLGSKISYINPMFAYRIRENNVTITFNNNSNYLVENGVLYTKDKEKLVTVLDTIVGKFTVDEAVKEISNYAFYEQKQMTEIKLNDNLTKIGDHAFRYCSVFTTITIPASVTTIGEGCFGACPNLNPINLECTEGSILGAEWEAPQGMRAINWNYQVSSSE